MKREEHIKRALEIAWDALQSHLALTYEKSPEGRSFHVQCVKDYATQIKHISELYDS